MPFTSLQDASEQKTELERLKHKIAEEVVKIEERKNKIDDELKEVQVSYKGSIVGAMSACQLFQEFKHDLLN